MKTLLIAKYAILLFYNDSCLRCSYVLFALYMKFRGAKKVFLEQMSSLETTSQVWKRFWSSRTPPPPPTPVRVIDPPLRPTFYLYVINKASHSKIKYLYGEITDQMFIDTQLSQLQCIANVRNNTMMY